MGGWVSPVRLIRDLSLPLHVGPPALAAPRPYIAPIYISPHARSLPTTPPCSLVPPGGWGAAVFALSTADDPRSWPNATERLRGGAHRVSLRSRATLPSGRVAIPFST